MTDNDSNESVKLLWFAEIIVKSIGANLWEMRKTPHCTAHGVCDRNKHCLGYMHTNIHSIHSSIHKIPTVALLQETITTCVHAVAGSSLTAEPAA